MCPDCARERAAREEAERERDEAREEIARHPRRCTADNKCEPCRSEERAWAETDAAESALASQRAARERAEREYEETILKLEAQMSGMEDAYRDSERARREAEDEIDRMRVAAAENFDESVAAQEIALAASSRLAAAEEEINALTNERNAALELAEKRGAAYDMTWREVESLRERLDKEEEERESAFDRQLTEVAALLAPTTHHSNVIEAVRDVLAERDRYREALREIEETKYGPAPIIAARVFARLASLDEEVKP